MLLLTSLLITGCASNTFSRDSSQRVDNTYDNADHFLRHSSDDRFAESYQNSSQIAQGILVGSATGAVAGGFITSGTAGILPGAGVGAIFGGVIGAIIERNSTLIDKLENRDVKVFVLGDQIRFIIPSQQLFRDGTPFLYPNSYTTLNLVAELLNHFATMSVKVAAYSDDSNTDVINCAQSKQQADSVVKYMWPRMNTRLMFAVGMGNTDLVVPVGGAENYRIEITTEKLPI